MQEFLVKKELPLQSLYKSQFLHHHPPDLILLKLEFRGPILQAHKLLQILNVFSDGYGVELGGEVNAVGKGEVGDLGVENWLGC